MLIPFVVENPNISVSFGYLGSILPLSDCQSQIRKCQKLSLFILIVFQVTMVWVMLRFIFTANSVTLDVLYASTAVYFLLAFLFVPVYGMLETASPGSFIDNTLHTPMHWQQFVYYSLVTLSTTGYGDVLPVSPWARMLAGLEATIGVLYVAILMARRVSLYDTQRRG